METQNGSFVVPPDCRISSADDAFALLRPLIVGKKCEFFWRIDLDRAGQVRGCRLLSTGRVDSVVPSIAEVFSGLEGGESRIILAHNHPSQDVSPSDADLIAAYLLEVAALERGIELVDCLILADGGFCSLRAAGVFD